MRAEVIDKYTTKLQKATESHSRSNLKACSLLSSKTQVESKYKHDTHDTRA